MLINFVGVGMAFNKKTRETTWHQVILREEDYYKALAELSLFKKGIKHPSPLQIQLETLFLSHEYINSSTFSGDLSRQEINCLFLAAHGVEIEETASFLNIKEDSVNKIRSNIFQKLNAKNITHSVFKSNKAGILTFDKVTILNQVKKKKISVQANTKSKEVENASA